MTLIRSVSLVRVIAFYMLVLLISICAQAASDSSDLEIVKLAVMIHPTGWAGALTADGTVDPTYRLAVEELRGGVYYSDAEFRANVERERLVNKRQRDLITRMAANEALVIFPGGGEAMRDMIAFCKDRLGKRCIVVHSPVPSKSPADDYTILMPENAKVELFDEIVKMTQEQGTGWHPGGLKVLLYTKLSALEIQEEFRKRNLRYDPARLEAVAFGEGFDECAISWKALLGYFLGLEKPIENDYELSVSGMPLLIGAEFKERIALAGDVRLFLWELKDGRSIAFFSKARSRFTEPALFVALPKTIFPVKLYSEIGAELWPGLNNVFSFDIVKRPVEFPGMIRVPVFTGMRLYQQMAPPVGDAVYIVSSVPFDAFRDALKSAPIGE